MTHIYDIHSYKGGTGVTTTACAIASHLSRLGKTLVVSTGKTDDILAWYGVSNTTELVAVADNLFAKVSIDPTLAINAGKDDYRFIVVDNGRTTDATFPDGFTVTRLCVARNDYMTLRNTVNRFQRNDETLVCFMLPEAALAERDVRTVVGSSDEDVFIPLDVAVQRALDAGLGFSRLDRLFAWAGQFVPDADKVG